MSTRRFEKYSDGITNFKITVYYENEKPFLYKVNEFCCQESEEFIKDMKNLKEVIDYVTKKLDYGDMRTQIGEEYMFHAWDLELDYGFECGCGYVYCVEKDGEHKFTWKDFLDKWLQNNEKEKILIETGTW